MTHKREKGCQMLYRTTFAAGLAVGFIVGARAGRERYEQLKKLGQRVVENPTVRQVARTAGTKAAELSKLAATQVPPKLSQTAKTGASKFRSGLEHLPGKHPADLEPAAANGRRPADS